MVELDSIQTEIKYIEDEIKNTQYNKATQHHVGLLKAKLAKLKEKQIARSSGGKKGEGFSVKKSGDATVILIGFPSVGKSTLLNRLTNAESKTAAYAFTTLTCIPGLMTYNHAKIQILDVPGILKGAAAGTGRGKEVLSVVQSADLVLFVLDVFQAEVQLEVLKKELYDSHLRLDQRKPEVVIKKASKGGVRVATTTKISMIDKKTVEAIFKEFKIMNADVIIREDINSDQLIDLIENNKKYLPSLVAINKVDLAQNAQLETVLQKIPGIPISAEENLNIPLLKQKLFEALCFIRIYLKEVGKKADMEVPIIMRQGDTIRSLCDKIHKDFVSKFKFAKLWGSSKFPGQKVGLDVPIKDKDVVEIHVR